MKEMELTENEFDRLYYEEKLSFAAIAKQYGTYSKKIQRMAKAWGKTPRTTSEAQKVALEEGRSEHRTEGRERTLEEREKISKSNLKRWESLSKEEQKRLKNLAAEHFKNMTPAERAKAEEARKRGMREASQQGSKLEKFLNKSLKAEGYIVDFHNTNLIPGTALEVDLLIPEWSTAIEIDGPMHWMPIWGAETLAKNMVADDKKSGLLLANGYSVIRMRCKTDMDSFAALKRLHNKIVEGMELIKSGKKQVILEV
jgi:very-short-patch-repair endonuclease